MYMYSHCIGVGNLKDKGKCFLWSFLTHKGDAEIILKLETTAVNRCQLAEMKVDMGGGR